MKKLLFTTFLALVMSLTLTACNNNNDTNGSSQKGPSGNTSQQEMAEFSRELVKFPENYDKGVNYTTVNRGNVREDLYTSQEAIEAVQNGQPIPDDTVITLEIYRDEKLDEIFVMEKRDGWVDQNPLRCVTAIGYTRNSMETSQWITRKTSVAAFLVMPIRSVMTS